MSLIICTVYDSKAEAYLRPFFAQSKGAAIRSLTDTVNSQDDGNMVAMHPEDYSLFVVGSWDENTGLLEKSDGKSHLIDCIDLVNKLDTSQLSLVESQAG